MVPHQEATISIHSSSATSKLQQLRHGRIFFTYSYWKFNLKLEINPNAGSSIEEQKGSLLGLQPCTFQIVEYHIYLLNGLKTFELPLYY